MTRITKRRTIRVRIEIGAHNHLRSRATALGVSISEYVRRLADEDRRKYAAELRAASLAEVA